MFYPGEKNRKEDADILWNVTFNEWFLYESVLNCTWMLYNKWRQGFTGHWCNKKSSFQFFFLCVCLWEEHNSDVGCCSCCLLCFVPAATNTPLWFGQPTLFSLRVRLTTWQGKCTSTLPVLCVSVIVTTVNANKHLVVLVFVAPLDLVLYHFLVTIPSFHYYYSNKSTEFQSSKMSSTFRSWVLPSFPLPFVVVDTSMLLCLFCPHCLCIVIGFPTCSSVQHVQWMTIRISLTFS